MDQEVKMRIVLEKPPAGIDFALQSGKGNNYQTVQKQRSGSQNLIFEFVVRFRMNEGVPNFLGTYVQGNPGDRFIYIDIGICAGQFDSAWSRRLKIPLKGISQADIEQVTISTHKILQTRVPGTGRDGTPSCATVKPFGGWHVIDI